MSSKHLRGIGGAMLLLLASCASTSGAADAPPSTDTQTFQCATDPRVQAYAANLHVPGSLNRAMFTLASADPALPKRGLNTWTLEVADLAGKGVPNASLLVTGYMPDHQHGWSTKPSITLGADGTTFTVAKMYLFMAGVWEVTVKVQGEGQAVVDYATFTVCVG